MNQQRSLTTSDGRFQLVMRRILFFTLIALAALVPAVTSFAEELFTAETIGDYGNVTVMEVSGNYDERTPEGEVNSLPRELIVQEFYRTHKDEYDFLAIFTNFDIKFETEAVAFYLGVKNDTLGIGERIFDNGYLYGSGGMLQGTIDMGNISKLVSSPLEPGFELSLDILAHEMLHRWSSFVKFRDSSGNLSTALLGKDGSHWSYLLDTKGSLQYGNSWRDNGDGTFTSVAARKYYSPLDLYLMGMIGSSKVPPMLLIDNPTIDPKKVSGPGDTISGTPRYVTIDDIIAAEGERVPNATDAQKQFKMAFILVTNGAVNRSELYGIENIRKGFLTRFSILTDGQGLVQIITTPIEDRPVNPGVQPPGTTPRTFPASIDDGVSWLLAAQNENGHWGSLRTAERDTAKAIAALENFTIAGQAQARGLQWIAGTGVGNTDYLSAKIAVLAERGQDFSTFIGSLLPRQNPDGGWGSDRNYLSNPIDTCSALKALLAANSTAAVGKGADYLVARQNPDGGWGFQADAPSNTLVTAEVSAMLQNLPVTSALATAVDRATAFLLSRRNADGGFGSSPSTVYETALAFRALSGVTTDTAVLGGAINYLFSSQGNDGSWFQDPYSTALAVEAIRLSGIKPAEIPMTGTVSGTVIDGATQQSLAGATVSLEGDSSITTVTAAGGSFSLSDVPEGTQTIVVSLEGYASYTKSASITAGSVVDLGTISLSPKPTTGIIKGVITSKATGEPLPEVSLTITGSFAWSGLTKEDGSFSIGNVSPGSITITASKAGYETVSASGTVTAGSVLSFNPQLVAQAPLPTTGSVAGRVLDAASGQPLTGVSVALQGDPGITVTTDPLGRFTLSGIPYGRQKLEFALSGYATSAIGVNVSAGYVVNIGTAALSANPPASAIRGVVNDAATSQPLTGVTVAIGGAFSGTTVTGADGSFAVSGVPPGAVTVTASKVGYYPVTVTGSVTAGGELFLNPRLSLMPPPATTGTMTGKIVDALTNQPLAGVTATLQGNSSITATSNATGNFTLTEIPPGTQRVDFSLAGYATSVITIEVAAGFVVDIGSLPLSANPTTGTIKGTITDAAGGEPLPGVTVAVTGSFSGSAVTGAEGTFEFTQIPPGSVELTVSKPGYYQVTGMGTVVAGGVQIFSPQMTLIPPQPTTGVVTGKVVDASTRETLSGVSVVVENTAIQSETDATGSFMLADIPAGLQNISFSLPGYSAVAAKLEIPAGFVIDLGTLPLSANPTTAILKGTITDAENGQPLEGAIVSFSGSSNGSAVTGVEGTFLVPEVAPGEISLGVSKPGYYSMSGNVSVVSGAVLFFNLQLTAIPPEPTVGTIMGRIVDGATNEPLSGVSVILKSDPVIHSMTDAAGGFTLADIPPGSQEFDFSRPGYATATATIEIAAGYIINLGTLPLSSNPTTGIIKGSITDAVDGRPLSGATITVTGSFTGSTVTGADGTFLFSQASPGSVTITISKPGYVPVTGTGTVNVGGVLVANAKLREAPPAPTTGDLSGKVLDGATLAPIHEAIVYLLGINPVATDALGYFTFHDLEPGTYEVTVSAPGYASQIHQVLIVAGAGAEMQIHLTPLFQSTTVTGTVTDASSGLPIAGADVVIPGTNMSAKTDSAGTYTISGIHLAEFNLRASAEEYDAKVISIKTSAYVMRSIDFNLMPNKKNNLLTIQSLATDKQMYTPHEAVSVTAVLENAGNSTVEVAVIARITDQQGNIIELLFPFGATTVTVDPLSTKTVALQWDTGQLSPGPYSVTMAANDPETGIMFSQMEASFAIEPVFTLTNATLNISPSFTYAGKNETVTISSFLTYASNITADADIGYTLKNSQGNTLHQGSVTALLPPAEQTVYKEIDQFTDEFAAGEYLLVVTVSRDGQVLKLLNSTFVVLPDIRIDMQRNVAPAAVVPDGTGKVRITIELKGGGK